MAPLYGGFVSNMKKKTEQSLENMLRRFLRSQKHAQRAARARITMWQKPFAQPTPLGPRDIQFDVEKVDFLEKP